MGVVTLLVAIAGHFLFGERIGMLAALLMAVIVICSAALVALVKP
jgi:multidrug transporter EmrE-like cation transporter